MLFQFLGMKIIKIKPPYKPLTQLPYNCMACALEWVLLRRGLKWIDQEEIGLMLSLKIPKSFAKYYTKTIPVTKQRKYYGTGVFTKGQTHKLAQEIFDKYEIPLKIKRFSVHEILNPKEFIVQNLKKGNDILLDFHWCGIGKRSKLWNIGHVCVVSGIVLNKDVEVVLGDPGYFMPKFWSVKLDKLIKAMDKKYDGHERGFWIISKK